MKKEIRQDWTEDEIREIYQQPLLELIYQAATVHRKYQKSREVQLCTLLSIKTGGCSEDCSYCAQSSRYKTFVKPQKLLDVEEVLEKAKKAKKAGSTRFCMGAAWRQVRNSGDFENVLTMVKQINEMGMEVCATLGMLTKEQIERLKEAGLYAYNHNLDTGREHYKKIITTRSYDDRLKTLEHVRDAGVSVCCGGILGIGDSHEDRISLLHTLATLPKHPDSVPINALMVVQGTPMEKQKTVPIWDMVRMIATARIIMPDSMVRLSAGRVHYSPSEQALCFMAGANSIFTGDKLLTTPNPNLGEDQTLLSTLGLVAKEIAS